jgi:P-type Ca2+ transporter type 2C
MDGPPALSLGVDPVPPRALDAPPRRPYERILNRTRLLRVAFLGAVMAAGTLAVLTLAPAPSTVGTEASVAGTMAFSTFVLFQVFNLVNVRSLSGSAFGRETFTNPAAFVATVAVVVLQIAVVNMPALQGFFGTVSLPVPNGWWRSRSPPRCSGWRSCASWSSVAARRGQRERTGAVEDPATAGLRGLSDRAAERVARSRVAGLEAGPEPLLPLGRRAMSEALRVDPAPRLLLDPVVAHR